MSGSRRGSVSWWCDCPGRQADCARVNERGHRRWYFAVRVDTSERDGRQVKRTYPTRKDAERALEHVRDLLKIADDDDTTRRRIGDCVVERSRRGGALPSVEEARRKFAAGIDPVAPSMTLNGWLDEWLAGKLGLRHGTIVNYTLRLRYWRTHLGDVPLNRLTAQHVQAVVAWMRERNEVVRQAREDGTKIPPDPLDPRGSRAAVPLSESTIKEIVGTLKMALLTAVDEGLLTRNPARRVKIPVPRAGGMVGTAWSPEQVSTFIDATANDRLGPLFQLVLYFGLRRGEVCGLQWSDVDWEKNRITVRRSLAYAARRSDALLVGAPKTESSARTVSVDASLIDALRRLRARQREERMAAGDAWRGATDRADDWVFTRPDGLPEPPYGVTRAFKRLAGRLGLPVIRLHDGRHTAATLALEAGQSPKVVADRLGHKSTRITLDLYGHVRPEVRDQAASEVVSYVQGGRR